MVYKMFFAGREREKSASSSADQYQRSWSRTGSGIDSPCGADLSHSPWVTPSTGGEVAGLADPTGCRTEPPPSKVIFCSLIKNLHLLLWGRKFVQTVESCYLFTFLKVTGTVVTNIYGLLSTYEL